LRIGGVPPLASPLTPPRRCPPADLRLQQQACVRAAAAGPPAGGRCVRRCVGDLPGGRQGGMRGAAGRRAPRRGGPPWRRAAAAAFADGCG
jgi:hypothetical protein